MTFQPIALDTFPKRQVAAKQIDIDAANAAYNMIAEGGASNGISDGKTYETDSQARTAARKAVRLVSASPAFAESGARVRTKVGKLNGSDQWSWAVYAEQPEQPKKGNK